MIIKDNKTEVPLEHYKEQFAAADPVSMAGKSGVEFKDGAFRTVFLGRPVKLLWPEMDCFYLDDGTKIEFWRDGSLKKIETYSTGNMPGDCMSESIGAYVNGHFPGCVVTKIERKGYGFEVELSNDIELKFNHRGVLIDIDD